MFFGYLLSTITTLLTAVGPRSRRLEAIKNKLQDVEEVGGWLGGRGGASVACTTRCGTAQTTRAADAVLPRIPAGDA